MGCSLHDGVLLRCVVAVDLGTSGVRAVAFTEALEVKAETSHTYGFETLAGGGAEQDVRAGRCPSSGR